MKPHSPEGPQDSPKKAPSEDKSTITLPGTVEKIIPPIDPADPEKAQIGVHGADHLYREIRVDNILKDSNGQDMTLKPGAQVDVTIEADSDATEPKKPSKAAASEASQRSKRE